MNATEAIDSEGESRNHQEGDYRPYDSEQRNVGEILEDECLPEVVASLKDHRRQQPIKEDFLGKLISTILALEDPEDDGPEHPP